MKSLDVLGDELFLPKAFDIVSNAEKSICISTFKLERSNKPQAQNLNRFLDLLISKAKKGVEIKMLCQYSKQKKGTPSTNYRVVREFLNAGIKVKYLANRVCHSKIILVDELKLIVGSHNISVMSVSENYELSLFIENSTISRRVLGSFESLYATANKIY